MLLFSIAAVAGRVRTRAQRVIFRATAWDYPTYKKHAVGDAPKRIWTVWTDY